MPENSQTTDVWSSNPLPDDMQITQPPILHGEPLQLKTPRYYPYQQQLTFRFGQAGNFPKISLDDNVLGFQYMFPKFLSPRLEAGADLHDEGVGHVHIGTRWFYNERGYFRPSAKISLDAKLDAKENLATFASIQNYYLRTTGTLEYVVWNPYSVRLETEFFFGSKNSLFELSLGISRGW